MYLTREDRWKPIIDKLRYGENEEIEWKQTKKNNKFVYIEGRKISPKNAYILSGIRPQFFDNYINQEVPIEDIMNCLDGMWVRKKARQLRVENLLK